MQDSAMSTVKALNRMYASCRLLLRTCAVSLIGRTSPPASYIAVMDEGESTDELFSNLAGPPSRIARVLSRQSDFPIRLRFVSLPFASLPP